jgi:hypothetical protein
MRRPCIRAALAVPWSRAAIGGWVQVTASHTGKTMEVTVMTSGNAERTPPEEAGCDDSVELCPLPPQLGRAGGAAPRSRRRSDPSSRTAGTSLLWQVGSEIASNE